MKPTFSIASQDSIVTIAKMMEQFYAIDLYPFHFKKTIKNLAQFINDASLGRIWLININEEPIGYIVLTFCFSFEFQGRNAFIDELYINDAFRNLGIGKKVMEFIEEQAIHLNINAIHLEVERHNEKGNRLYSKQEFYDNNRTLLTKKIPQSDN